MARCITNDDDDNATVSTKMQLVHRTHTIAGCQYVQYRIILATQYVRHNFTAMSPHFITVRLMNTCEILTLQSNSSI
jgi:hypothetical protein